MADYSEKDKSPYEASEYNAGRTGRRMDLGTLKALLDAQKVAALAAMQTSKLSSERDDALMYYVGDMSKDMPAIDGRSQAVSSDVQDTIEGLLPTLMEIFTGSEEVVKFNPVGPEDVGAAEQETDYVNHVIMNENPGFLILYSFIKDALLSKVGIVKCWWEEEDTEDKETYHDLTEDQFNIIVADPEVEIIEHTVKPEDSQTAQELNPQQQSQVLQGAGAGPQSAPQPGGPAQSPQPVPTQSVPQIQNFHDVKVVKRRTYGKVKISPVAPEEFGIEKTARTLRQGFIGGCNYCFHRVIRAQDDIIGEGFDPDQIRSLPTYMAITNIEEINRDTVAEHQNVGEEMNPAARRIEIIEHYVRMDYEGDGKARLYQVFTGSEQGQILYKNGEPSITEFDEVPFAAMTPVIVTHRFFGRSLADLTMEIQRIKTSLLRALLDNAYLANNPRVVVSETGASDSTLDDLLISRPGGVVRVKSDTNAISWQEVPTIGSHVFPLLEYADEMREIRSGVARQGQSITADALQNQSATATNQLFSAIQSRQRLIARILAETGIKDLCILVHGLIRKHGQQKQTVRLRNQWITVDPRDWKKRNDMIVNVGLGTGGKAEQLATGQLIVGLQEKALMAGKTNLVTDENLYNSAQLITRIAGHKDVDAFFSDPKTQPPPQPQQNPEMVKAQVEQMKMQGAQQLEQQKIQADIVREKAQFQADSQLEQQKFEHQKQLDMLEMGMKREEHGQKMQLELHKHSQNMELQQQKAQTDAHLQQQKQSADSDNAKIGLVGGLATAKSTNPAHHENVGKMVGAIVAPHEHNQQLIHGLAQLHAHHAEQHQKTLSEIHHALKNMAAPRRIVRDAKGRVSHVETVQ